jgi:2,3-bisphosphoglycerate-dependent phosphoglycerate mutase
MAANLILLRHGQSTWNLENRFTGWYDCPLSEQGCAEATAAGQLLRSAGVAPTVLHTSLQTRAIVTAELALRELDRSWIPAKRHWRLNERHYGDLTGLDKAQTAAKHGADQVQVWRRSYDTPPPPIADDNPWNPNSDERYAGLAPELVPRAECLKDVVDRMLPYWYDAIITDLAAGETVLIAAHGNSLRALAKHLNQIPDDEISELNIPTGVPLLYEIGTDMAPTEDLPVTDRYLGDPEAIAAAAEAVARQAAT